MRRNTFDKPVTSNQKKIKKQAIKTLIKLKIKKDKKDRARFDHNYIFCIINERDIFSAMNTAIDRGTLSTDQNRNFTLIGLQIFDLLIEYT